MMEKCLADSKVKTDGKPFQFWPIPSGKAMSIYWSDGRLYYVVLGEDKLKNPQCQGCARISNMEFGWKSQQNVPLFVCTNIEEIKPRICEPIEWEGRLMAESDCPYYEKAKPKTTVHFESFTDIFGKPAMFGFWSDVEGKTHFGPCTGRITRENNV